VEGYFCDIRKCKALFAKQPACPWVDPYRVLLTGAGARSASLILDRAATVVRTRKAAAHSRLAAAPSGGRLEVRRRRAKRGPRAPK
jgi:hypothetical protein